MIAGFLLFLAIMSVAVGIGVVIYLLQGDVGDALQERVSKWVKGKDKSV